MRVLVTANKGFIGTVRTPILDEADHVVSGFDIVLYRGCSYGGDLRRRQTEFADAEPESV